MTGEVFISGSKRTKCWRIHRCPCKETAHPEAATDSVHWFPAHVIPQTAIQWGETDKTQSAPTFEYCIRIDEIHLLFVIIFIPTYICTTKIVYLSLLIGYSDNGVGYLLSSWRNIVILRTNGKSGGGIWLVGGDLRCDLSGGWEGDPSTILSKYLFSDFY